MRISSTAPYGLLLAGAFIGVLSYGAAAQTASPPTAAPAAAQPLPPGSPMIGRPENEAAQKLAPVAAPPLAAAADKLPIDKLKVPAGFTSSLCRRHGECPFARVGRQGHGLRR